MGKKNESGKYRGRVQIGVDRDGKPINKYVCASTMRELEQKKEEIRQHYIEGVPIREDMPFYQYAEEWYKVRKEPFISDASRSAYRFHAYEAHSPGLRSAPPARHHSERVASVRQYLRWIEQVANHHCDRDS